ncbi:GatB/YqeY domain-containing protein [bacterium]|nr:GatB/YqeY domain-containing protein [bacterium]
MSLLNQLTSDYTQAMKDRAETKKIALNFVLAQAKQKRIDTQKELTDDDIIALLKKEIKSINEAISFLEKAGNKADEIAIEREKIQIFQSYLPAMLDKEQTKKLIETLIAQLHITDLKTQRGILMKELMGSHKSEIDSNLVNELIATRDSQTTSPDQGSEEKSQTGEGVITVLIKDSTGKEVGSFQVKNDENASQSIQELAAMHGIEIPLACGGGVCGVCLCKVESGGEAVQSDKITAPAISLPQDANGNPAEILACVAGIKTEALKKGGNTTIVLQKAY